MTEPRARWIHLDEIEPARIGESLWKPIRSELGVEAFGVNAYVAEEAGDTLFDEHDETESGAGGQRHEELYVVLAGRATFWLGSREVDAPAGTLVFLKDPAERRAARAAERARRCSRSAGRSERVTRWPWEYWFRAQRELERDGLDEARAIAEEGLARYPDDRRLRRLLDG